MADRVHAGLTYVDQAGGGDVTESVLRDRRHLSDDGLVLVIARIDSSDGSLVGEVEVVTRGFGAGDGRGAHRGDPPGGGAQPRRASAEQRVTEVGVLQHQLHDAVAGAGAQAHPAAPHGAAGDRRGLTAGAAGQIQPRRLNTR